MQKRQLESLITDVYPPKSLWPDNLKITNGYKYIGVK